MRNEPRQRPCGVCFIVPSRLLRKLAEQASDAERSALLDTLMMSEHLRGQRTAFSLAGAGLVVPAGEKRRTVYDAGHARRLPGKLMRGEGAPPSECDPVVNDAYDSAGDTFDFYAQVLERNSIDGRGMRIDSTIHYGRHFNNAFWNGRQMVYGDGDGKLFSGFAKAIDVVGHELTHGVTQHSVPGGGLVYEGESGALNESISDVFGTLVKQWKRNEDVRTSNWLIGEGILSQEHGKAMRSMSHPGTAWSGDDQPADMTGFVQDGDVHTNSGIPNHAFFLAATGIGGYAWQRAGRIWYRALQMLQPTATFQSAAQATIAAAAFVCGDGSTEQKAVQAAWRKVKVI